MRFKFIFIVFIFSGISLSFAQVKDSIRIRGEFHDNIRYASAVLVAFGSEEKAVLKSPIKQGVCKISLPADLTPGIYRLVYSQSEAASYIDLILNGSEPLISFSLDANKKETVVFKESDSNKRWYGYLLASRSRLLKIEMLSELWMNYPDRRDKILSAVKSSIEKEKEHYQNELKIFIKENKGSWQADMAANTPYYFTDLNELQVLQDYDRRNHYWDHIDTQNEGLLHSPLYTDHILNYLRYYMNPQMHFGEQEMEEGFKKSSDTIMAKFGGNGKTQKFALQYLIRGFKEIGQEKVLQYIDQKYAHIALQCQDDQEKEAFEQRMACYELLKNGVKAPDFSWYDKDGVVKKLNDIAGDKVLVVFWASWCTHCQQMMPSLNEFALNNPNIKVLAVSLDDDQDAFMRITGKFNNMLHFCDFKKWNSDPVIKYNIVATPSFFLLDKERRIIDKYASFEGFITALAKMQ
ncbi:TlpA family protein disulfide reductase [Flavobacterium humidisoli]|uniref:TlpA family protein disulfide reductase n=1 Tax=Flavobacterium humidisoli TaxID=2937442 RepID=A0ABY4LXR3_9FLAO|nr:TlpA disulfide reductase family protein [Flavobacterium humidisoli]UPZ17885.1 TlpA family protein disulfide reductase [Flavobacterium humidisoli]